jgi:hypothetical protein
MLYIATILLFVLPEHRKKPTFNVYVLYDLIICVSLLYLCTNDLTVEKYDTVLCRFQGWPSVLYVDGMMNRFPAESRQKDLPRKSSVLGKTSCNYYQLFACTLMYITHQHSVNLIRTQYPELRIVF